MYFVGRSLKKFGCTGFKDISLMDRCEIENQILRNKFFIKLTKLLNRVIYFYFFMEITKVK